MVILGQCNYLQKYTVKNKNCTKQLKEAIDRMIQHYIFLGIVSTMAMLLLYAIIKNNEILSRKMKMFFTYAILGTIIVTLCEIGTYFFEKPYMDFRLESLFCNVIGFSISPFIPVFMALSFCNADYSKLKIWVFPATLNMIFIVLSPFFDLMFSISVDNIYTRGPWFFIYVLSYVWGILLLIYETIRLKKRYQTKNSFVLYFLLLFIIFGTSIQVILPTVHTTWICISLAITIYYAYFCEICEKFDVQTYLLNRRAYNCEVERVAESSQATILIFDVDEFKEINDTYGHQFGDECLYTVACCIKDVFQNIGLCYRIGGDEFCVISKVTDETIILDAKKMFLKKIANCKEKDRKLPNVSIGHGFYKKGLCRVDEAIKNADEQLYSFKKLQKVNADEHGD